MILKKINDILSTKECESFSIAFLFHAVILLCLALIFSAIEPKKQAPIIDSGIVQEELSLDANTIEITETEKFDQENTSFQDVQPTDSQEDSSLKIENVDIPSTIDPVSDIGVGLPSPDFLSDHLSGVSTNIGAGVSAESSTGGALDRLTVEIINNSRTKDLTVVWLFDASISLSYQRDQIYNRFDKILQELSLSTTSKTINHSICSFGQSVTFITSDVNDDVNSLKSDIKKITLDESGIENTFNAVGEVCKKYATLDKKLMVIVFTDEVGEDISKLDIVSSLVRSKGSMIYVVGSPAPFGKSTTQFKFVEFDPKYESAEKWVEIQQGPETLQDMILDIHSLPIDDETLDSGFGPFALSKLCYETGGIFFSVHPDRNNSKNHRRDISPLSSYISRFFDSEVMRLYKPDYRPLATQIKENNTHITKQALLKACSVSLNISGEQTLRFKAFNEGMFAEELGMAQRFSAKLEPKINEVYNILSLGESSHLSLTDKRWLASYALAMGRILSTKCRIESYNLVLAEAKTGLKKQDPKTNIWILLPSKEFKTTNSILRKHYESSQKYLKYVIENFPNTPWALIANEELNTPIGYSWVEDYQEPPKPNNGGGGNNNPQDDKMKPKLIPKPVRKISKI